jgi:2-C-methyl-D-erythritol 4-phosphate cytidylyltransferase/2-C-methyl-D-erythritol 2,4-cyclodiphosphate synthase
MKTAALLMAAGRGQRLGEGEPKCFRHLAGKPLLKYSLSLLSALPHLGKLAVVLPAAYREDPPAFLQQLRNDADLLLVAGGDTRQDSVWQGLLALEEFSPALVIIHDGARPFTKPELFQAALETAARSHAALAAAPVTDTLKRVKSGTGKVTATVPRQDLWRAQTPQVFDYKLIYRLHAEARQEGREVTDDAALVEEAGLPVEICPSDDANFKVTSPADWERAEHQLGSSSHMRIGHGYDFHALAEGLPLVLGGVEIDSRMGPLAHSDGDVVCHALADALLGALALGDIGMHFPDSDPQYAGAYSLELLGQVAQIVHAQGYRLINCDVTVQAQTPRLAPFVAAMRESLAKVLACKVGQVSIKATTMERLGPIGEEQALAAHAVVLLEGRP